MNRLPYLVTAAIELHNLVAGAAVDAEDEDVAASLRGARDTLEVAVHELRIAEKRAQEVKPAKDTANVRRFVPRLTRDRERAEAERWEQARIQRELK